MAKQSLLSRLEDKSDSTRVDNFDNKSYVHPYFDDSQTILFRSITLHNTSLFYCKNRNLKNRLKKKSNNQILFFWIFCFYSCNSFNGCYLWWLEDARIGSLKP